MDKNIRLNELKKRKEVLMKKHGFKSFSTESEIKEYIVENKIELTELKQLLREIYALELEIMSPIERELFLEEQKKSSRETF